METRAADFDGVICFGGGDWWYHNRGHYDMQMCRELSRVVPVLLVNSIGIRIPRITEGSMFVRRVARKLKSLRRGFVRVDDRFGVMSPVAIPGRWGAALSRRTLARLVRSNARKMGIRRPLVWVTCPPAADALPGLDPVGVVYQRTDRWESFPEADPEAIRAYHRILRARADVTLFCSTLLFEEEGSSCRAPAYVDHGVDFDRFAQAGRGASDPPDVAPIPHPRAGFVGGIDSSTFDPELFERVVQMLPEVQFVLVGACTIDHSWARFPNVWLLGQKPYEEVPSYMASCDVLLMPWNRSDWIRACNPVKLKEYLAVGRPVVSTSFVELAKYEGLVRIADGAEAFARAITQAIEDPGDPEPGRTRVAAHGWTQKANEVLELLSKAGIRPSSRATPDHLGQQQP